MPLDPLLVELLVCPRDKEPLWYLEEESLLYNPRLRLAYPIREGIPVLLVEEAEELDEAGHERLAARHAKQPVTTGLGPPRPVGRGEEPSAGERG